MSSSSIAIEPPTGGVPPGRVRGAETTAHDQTESNRTEQNRNTSPPAAGGLTGEASLVPKADRAMGNILYTGSILGFWRRGALGSGSHHHAL